MSSEEQIQETPYSERLEKQLDELAELAQESPHAHRLGELILATDDVDEVVLILLQFAVAVEKDRMTLAKELTAASILGPKKQIILHHSEVTA